MGCYDSVVIPKMMVAAFLYYPGYGAINRNKTTMKEN